MKNYLYEDIVLIQNRNCYYTNQIPKNHNTIAFLEELYNYCNCSNYIVFSHYADTVSTAMLFINNDDHFRLKILQDRKRIFGELVFHIYLKLIRE